MTTSRKPRGIGRRAALAAGGSLLAFPAIQARAAGNGVALVIGNSKYHWEAQLPNVRRDAPDVARRLQALGLTVELVQDATRERMAQAIDKLRSASSGANLSVFYFAGHGASWGRDTYLVPVDSDLTNPSVVTTLIQVPSIRDSMKDAANRLLIFDNCRNNPADGWRQLEAQRSAGFSPDQGRDTAARGLPNSLALFSTAPGHIALDGPPGENSPFAGALLRQLDSPSIDLQALAGKLRRELLIATQGRQVLWDSSSYQQPFVLSGPAKPSGAGASRSGWGADPSKIVDLPNTYRFAQENGFYVPAGLIAHRPTNNPSAESKVGSYKLTLRSPQGGQQPGILVIMSVDEPSAVRLIMIGRNEQAQNGWIFRTGTLSGNRLEYYTRDQGARFVLDWSDANSGSMAAISESGGQNAGRQSGLSSTRFSRLDG